MDFPPRVLTMKMLMHLSVAGLPARRRPYRQTLLLVTSVGVSVALGACNSHDVPATRDSGDAISRAKAAVARGEPIPGVANADTSPKPGEGLPYPGAWTPTITYGDSLFTIERPASSTVESPSTESSYDTASPDVAIRRLPDCKWSCAVSVSVWRDVSGGGLPAVVRALTAPDTTQQADFSPEDATIIDSLPLGSDPALHMRMSCGDCGLREILTSHRGWMAKIEYAADDREGFSPALTEHLATVARSFRWRK